MIAAGIGFRRSCGIDELVTLISQALRLANLAKADLLAVPLFKSPNMIAEQTALRLNLELVWVTEARLQSTAACCQSQSLRAMPGAGFASVAEAAALGAVDGYLLQPRLKSAQATCALAVGARWQAAET